MGGGGSHSFQPGCCWNLPLLTNDVTLHVMYAETHLNLVKHSNDTLKAHISMRAKRLTSFKEFTGRMIQKIIWSNLAH